MTNRIRSRFAEAAIVAGLLAASLLLAGCPTGLTVAKLEREPGHYQGKQVAVHGTVTEAFGLLGQGAYEVDDGTGRIWVLSGGYGVPGKGAKVTVVGDFVGGATLGTRSFANAIRQTRKPHY